MFVCCILINIFMFLSMFWFGFVGVVQVKLFDWVEFFIFDIDMYLYSVGLLVILDLVKKVVLVEFVGKVNSWVQQFY